MTMTQTKAIEMAMTETVEAGAAEMPGTAAAAPVRAGGFPPAPRDANGRFLPGSPGRQPGQRNLISGRVARHILKRFETKQDELLERMERWWLPQYMRMIVQLLPKNGAEGLAGEEALEAAELAAALKAALAAAERREAG